MLLEIPPKMSVSGFIGCLKGKSSQIIYEKWGNLRYKYRSREFWCRGYYADTAGKDTKKIQKYIQNQLKEDQIAEQLELELQDPFNKKGYGASSRPLTSSDVALGAGLCPHMKNHQLGWWIIILFSIYDR